jgi:serine/threonine-protein kinase
VLAPTEQDLPKPGDFVAAKYRVEEILGRGGMGAVFRVTHSVTGKSFAVKWLLPQYNGGQEMAQRFIREAQVAGRVDHPNIVEVYDIGEDRGSMYMVMELLQGESLAAHIARVGRIPANQACQLLIPVARGLAAAHRSGIIHRDLKPDNIFLSVSTLGEPRPKILDFGISKMSALASDANPALTREGVVMGTPHYMAPEQLRSHKVDERCDIYALGVILYQMLSGKLPFTGDNFPDLMLKIISEPPVPLAKLAPDAPRDLIAIVETAMSRSAAERFDTVAELGRALEQFGQGALFDVEQALSTRPVASVLPGPSTPVATESRFPDTVAQPVSVLQRARRIAFPLAISGVSAVLFSIVYASLGDPTQPAPASAAELRLDAPVSQRSPRLDPKPVGDALAVATPRHTEDDTLPVPAITLGATDSSAAAQGGAAAPALIGAPASSEEELKAAAPPQEAPAEAADGPQQLPAGLSAPPQTAETPVPIAPPGAAAPSGDSDPTKKQKKAAAATKPQKGYENPELRINDFL